MTNNEIDDIIESIIDEKNDRALLILSSSLIDDLLYHILNKYLLDPLKSNEENLIKGDNPLGSFSSRIKMVYRLGIIDRSFLNILDKIRDIRNKCAHRTSIKADKSPIKDDLNYLYKLLEGKESINLTKKRYLIDEKTIFAEIKVAYISICIILKVIYDNIDPIKPNNKLVKISTK
jgi:DNA-binding MltR family transcriptional regulator